MSVLIGALVVALVVLVALRTGGRASTAVGAMRLTRERRVKPERRRLQVRVPFERRRGPRREEEVADAFVRRVHTGAKAPRGRRSAAL